MSVLTLIAAWFAGIFGRKLSARELLAEIADDDSPAARERRPHLMLRVIPEGVDREAYRKVQRAVRKMQRKIDAGKMTEAEAMKALGLEVE